ncbi:MAG: hypothetical protein CL808_07110 [Citromicrobium sp.]|nr:hypothetical protein [Citromicrobium sp.]
MTLVLETIRDDGLVRGTWDGVGIADEGKNSWHIGGCACAACLQHDDNKQFAPGTGTSNAEDTIPGSTATTATLTPGSRATSAIDTAGDSDWFRIDLTAGQTYTFTTYLPGGGLSDSILTLRDSSGVEITTNDDANTGAGLYYSEITFTATSTGTFFLDVTGYSSSTGQYVLSSSRPLADAVGHTAATATAIDLGTGAVAGALDQTGDRDWYAVTLEAGETYEFVTSATGGANDVDTTLTLRDGSGNVLAYNDDSSGTYSRIRFTAETSGTFYIDVGGWADSEQGSYQLEAGVAEPLQLFDNDQIADQLLNGYWGGSGAARSWDVAPGGSLTVNITALTTGGQFLAREALNLWSDVLGVSFNEVTTGGQMTFDDDEEGAFASVSRIGNVIQTANVNVEEAWLTNYGATLDSYAFQAYIHEIGHALGLGHAGNYNSTADYTQDASYLNDAWSTTVMSYFDQAENDYFAGLGFSRVFAITPQSADIVAIQTSYGFATTTRTGDTIYGFGNTSGREVYGVGDASTNSAGRLLSFTIVDHGGTDTLNYSSFSFGQTINLNSETFSSVGGSTGNMSIARGTVIENAIGGSGDDSLIGNSASNFLTGWFGNDLIDGGDEVDTAVVRGNRSAYTITQGATGVFTVSGADGTDVLTNIEYLQFDDQTIRLLPGTGVAVNFDTADPSVYQAAMNNIRDFDGNDLGGDGFWLRIGSADVDGDGDIDQILVNDAIGRFATVGAAEDGLYYFDDYSWAGETRVAGIYIDPLIATGDVVPGSDFDSQRRFQNDLEIENINRVLGADDYDGDGYQEVYFGLTDGTAYLHAYMHADGNIRYANYQSEQQVIDFLTANGYDSSTWADWFPSSAEGSADSGDKAVPVMEVLDGGFTKGDHVPVMEYPDAGDAKAAGEAPSLDVASLFAAPATMVEPGHWSDMPDASIHLAPFGLEHQPPVEVFA